MAERRTTTRRRTTATSTRATASPSASEIESLLSQARANEVGANERLFAALYETLRGFARAAMREQSPSHTLQPTALVNEVYMKLARRRGGWQGRAQFLSTAARAMRCVLVDHARTKKRRRRSPTGRRVVLDDVLIAYEESAIDVLALDETLRNLAEQDPRSAQIVELRFFGGLSLPDISRLLEIPLRTVERDWQWARVWLRAQLG